MFYNVTEPSNGYGSRDPEHIRRWVDAQVAGQRRALKCAAARRDGEPCRMHCIPGTSPRRCFTHLHGPARDAYDRGRTARLQRDLASGSTVKRQRAVIGLAGINKRALHRLWLHSPDTPGTTLALEPHDERRVRHWLVQRAIDLDNNVPDLTPRAVDRVRWAAFLNIIGKIDDAAAARRLFLAQRDDARWRAKTL